MDLVREYILALAVLSIGATQRVPEFIRGGCFCLNDRFSFIIACWLSFTHSMECMLPE